jgi:hypothetical protein
MFQDDYMITFEGEFWMEAALKFMGDLAKKGRYRTLFGKENKHFSKEDISFLFFSFFWIRIHIDLVSWIRIRIRIGDAYPDPDTRSWKLTKINLFCCLSERLFHLRRCFFTYYLL